MLFTNFTDKTKMSKMAMTNFVMQCRQGHNSREPFFV